MSASARGDGDGFLPRRRRQIKRFDVIEYSPVGFESRVLLPASVVSGLDNNGLVGEVTANFVTAEAGNAAGKNSDITVPVFGALSLRARVRDAIDGKRIMKLEPTIMGNVFVDVS